MSSVLPIELKSFDYYLSKIPQYLRTSETFTSHFKILYDFIIGSTNNNGVVNSSDIFLTLLNIFDNNYLTLINSLKGTDKSETTDILDKLANFFGYGRNLTVVVDNVKHELTLTDDEILLLVKAKIVSNYCEGTREQITKYYKDASLSVIMKYNDDVFTTIDLILNTSEYSYSNNVKNMFLAGLLSIESMGIQYNYTVVDISKLLVWDSTEKDRLWDGGLWSI